MDARTEATTSHGASLSLSRSFSVLFSWLA
jgi:hypothetical protein